jgi:hypothetical protein
MRLEAKASISWGEFVDALANQRKIGEEPKSAEQAGVIGVGLINTEFAFGEVVDVDEVGTGSLGKSIFSHGDARRLAAGRRQECRRECPW